MRTDPNRSFDEYAAEYDTALGRGLSVSGEPKDYFARRRIEWLRNRLRNSLAQFDHVMDYGCGTGSSAPLLIDILGAGELVGTDTSPKLLQIASQKYGSDRAKFLLFDDYRPDGKFDLVYCNGVFHHIPLSGRAAAANYIYRSIRPGGWFAFWENNPWNPGARLVMSRIPFDRDAIMISAPQARSLLTSGGFDIHRTDFLFIFPNVLSWLRWMEPFCSGFPAGAQYLVLCRKSVDSR
jgi:SAM-dependent methyltransferase